MNLNRVRHQLLILITTIAFFLGGISTALAADTYGNYQNNQELNQAATLTAPSSDRPIEIYPQPDSKKSPLGKAQKGDRVIVMQQIEGNRGTQWDYVKFEQKDRGEGWIQQDYVAIQTQQSSQSEQKPAQPSQSQSSPTYSQQEDYPNSQQSSKYKTEQKQTYSQTKQNQQKAQNYKGNQ